MHDAAFAAAARPTRCVILGLLMKPYSIGHELLLVQSLNPLLSNPAFFNSLSREERNKAVIYAALICCNSWKQNQQPHRWLWLWYLRRVNGADWQKEADNFIAYRQSGGSIPPIPTEEADMMANGKREVEGRHLGGPFAARLLNFASGFSDNEIRVWGDSAFDYPFGLAAWRYMCLLEANDSTRIENATEFQYRTEMEQHRKDWEAENPGKEAVRPL